MTIVNIPFLEAQTSLQSSPRANHPTLQHTAKLQSLKACPPCRTVSVSHDERATHASNARELEDSDVADYGQPDDTTLTALGLVKSSTAQVHQKEKTQKQGQGEKQDPKKQKWNVRLYEASLTYEATIRGQALGDTVSIYWRLAVRSEPDVCLQSPTVLTGFPKLSMPVKMHDLLAQEFCAASTKYSMFSADHSIMDLGALIEQLASGVAVYANYGVLGFDHLCGGRVPNTVALQPHAVRATAGDTGIFVPACIDTGTHPGVMSAIIAAATACGSLVITDIVPVDSATGKPIMPTCHNASLADGCYEALRIIGGQYEKCGAGDVFSLALIRGLHRVYTVLGHTDEGAVMRRILRRGAFAKPFGGISITSERLTLLAAPASDSVASWRQVFDGIVLASAGLVAQSDPCVVVDGKQYPTTFVYDDEGTDEEKTIYHMSCLAEVMPKFANIYCRNLSALFGLVTSSGEAARMLTFSTASAVTKADRHMTNSIVAPFFWIEPTGVVPSGYASFCHNRTTGALAFPMHSVTEKAFSDHVELVDEDVVDYTLGVEFTSLRQNALLSWLAVRPDDGLGFIDVVGCDSTQFVCPGPDAPDEIKLGCSARGPFSLGTLRWRSSDNPLPKPHEGMYVGGGLQLNVGYIERRIRTKRTDRGVKLWRAVPPPDDVLSCTFKVSVTGLTAAGYAIGGHCSSKMCDNITLGALNLGLAVRAKQRAVRSGYRKVFENRDWRRSAPAKMDEIPAPTMGEGGPPVSINYVGNPVNGSGHDVTRVTQGAPFVPPVVEDVARVPARPTAGSQPISRHTNEAVTQEAVPPESGAL